MTRSLDVIPGADPAVVFEALRHALSGDGPAILPHAGGPLAVPATVSRKIALVVETSGSTGRPKRVALSADALLASAAASDSALATPGQWLLALPATYIAGINVLVRSLSSQTEPVMMAPGHFDAAGFIEASERLVEPARFTSLVPTQLARLLESDAAITALRRFDRILVGGQSTPAAIVDRCRELGIHLTRTYGSSETSGGCVYDGVAIGMTGVRIVEGEVQLGGPVLAEGYLADPARTDAAFVSDGSRRWYRTGDGGELVDGVLRVTGRLDDVIISGGIKVSLGAVEAAVREVAGFAAAVVVPGHSEEWGEVPVVVLATHRTDAAADLEHLRDLIGRTLGRAAAPARIVPVETMPLLASGKPDRLSLRSVVDR